MERNISKQQSLKNPGNGRQEILICKSHKLSITIIAIENDGASSSHNDDERKRIKI